ARARGRDPRWRRRVQRPQRPGGGGGRGRGRSRRVLRGERRRRPEHHDQHRGAARRADHALKLQSLLPMKFSGVAATIASACAGTFWIPAYSTSTYSSTTLKANATSDTTRKRAAWKPASPAP